MKKVRSFSPATVIAIVALFFSLTGTAVAGALITGANVKNGTLTGADLKNGSVGTVDIKNGTILPIDVKGGVFPTGPQGEQGPAGPAGPQGPQGQQGVAGLSGHQVVLKHSVVDSSPFKLVGAVCPAGKKPIGGGALAFDGGFPKEITIVGSYPTATGWNAVAREAVAFAPNWRLTAYVICATVAA